jgi:hypothetical protein
LAYNVIAQEETFEDVSDDFRLYVFSTFSSKEAAIFNEECRKLHEVSDRYGLGKFVFNLKTASSGGRWDKHFMNEKLMAVKNDIEKVYVVGPVPFMEDISTAVRESDLNVAAKIFLV